MIKNIKNIISSNSALLGHSALVLVLIAFIVFGGWLFIFFEYQNFSMACYDIQRQDHKARNELKKKVLQLKSLNYSQNRRTLEETILSLAIRKFKDNYQIILVNNAALLTNVAFNKSCITDNPWNLPNSVLFTITTISTIGYGTIYPITPQGKILLIFYAFIGILLFLLFASKMSKFLGNKFRKCYFRIWNFLKNFFSKKFQIIKMTFLRKKITNENMTESYKKQMVPLTIVLLMILGIIMIGSLIFNSFEGWGLIGSGYFSFISLTTIGLGDLVPGQNPNENINYRVLKVIVGFFYILFGLTVISMCFDLVQEDFAEKFKILGRKLHLLPKENVAESNTEI